jgi:hypothetical protein
VPPEANAPLRVQTVHWTVCKTPSGPRSGATLIHCCATRLYRAPPVQPSNSLPESLQDGLHPSPTGRAHFMPPRCYRIPPGSKGPPDLLQDTLRPEVGRGPDHLLHNAPVQGSALSALKLSPREFARRASPIPHTERAFHAPSMLPHPYGLKRATGAFARRPPARGRARP